MAGPAADSPAATIAAVPGTTDNAAPARQAATPARPMAPERDMANVLRALAIDAVQAAGSGHSDLPVTMADVATTLWTRFLKFDAADPAWPDRDRFVLSAGHGAMLLYALLHVTGQAGMGIDDLRRFRQLHSPAAGHPEYGEHPGIETTSGPPGQGLATAVGMALAERLLAARFGRSLVDHRTWVIACDGDLAQGVSHEAIGLAGHLRLDKLTLLCNHHGDAAAANADDAARRFAAAGWAVKQVDGHHPGQIAGAISFAMRSKKPTLIACRTGIALGASAPDGTQDGTRDAQTASLSTRAVDQAKAALGCHAPPFTVPDALAERWHTAGSRGAGARRGWLKRLARHQMRAEFERAVAGRLPDAFHEAVAALRADIAQTRPRLASRHASQMALEALLPAIPELVGGSADPSGCAPAGCAPAPLKAIAAVAPGNFAGRYILYGIREHGMAAAANGLALHGGVIPSVGCSFVATDSMRPAIRLAALMRQRVVHVLTHDSIGLGGDGQTHQPVEHLASLRAMHNLHVFRPADAMETAECWELAIRRTDGPSLLVLTCQALPALRTDTAENRSARGGYVLAEAEGPRRATLIATGSEVAIAMAAREALAAHGIAVAVVSLPCWEAFAAQDAAWREEVLGGAPRIGIEAAGGFGWDRWLGPDGTFIGMQGYGASAPFAELYQHFGITPEAIVATVRKLG